MEEHFCNSFALVSADPRIAMKLPDFRREVEIDFEGIDLRACHFYILQSRSSHAMPVYYLVDQFSGWQNGLECF